MQHDEKMERSLEVDTSTGIMHSTMSSKSSSKEEEEEEEGTPPSMEDFLSDDDYKMKAVLNRLDYSTIPEHAAHVVAGMESKLKLLANQCHLHRIRHEQDYLEIKALRERSMAANNKKKKRGKGNIPYTSEASDSREGGRRMNYDAVAINNNDNTTIQKHCKEGGCLVDNEDDEDEGRERRRSRCYVVLRKKIRNYELHNWQLDAQLQGTIARCRELQQRCNDAKNKARHDRATLDAQKAQIKVLRDGVRECKGKVEGRDNMRRQLSRKLEAVGNYNTTLKERIAELNEGLRRKDNEISNVINDTEERLTKQLECHNSVKQEMEMRMATLEGELQEAKGRI
ncbi:hypothetical protein FOZ63_000767, partial [Perkinsus olseni]